MKSVKKIKRCNKLLDSYKLTGLLTVFAYMHLTLLFALLALMYIIFGKDKKSRMFHGAEHKILNTLEKCIPLTTENIEKEICFSKRCGTTQIIYATATAVLFKLISAPWFVALFLNPIVVYLIWRNKERKIIEKILAPANLFSKFLQLKVTTLEPGFEHIELAVEAIRTLEEHYCITAD